MGSGQLELGSIVGGYRLDAVIGAGGMGAVYRATHVKLGRRAAIKVLNESLAADPVYLSRFFHEARVVNAVGHPNIIDIIDFIDTQSPRRVAYVMELIEGPPLSKLLASRRLTVKQSLNIAIQMCDALSAVHGINVIHRDLKPDNLLVVGSLDTDLSDRPSIKVLDFGIAKIQEHSSSHRTNTGMMLGTPAYMAPEQVAGESVSVKTDVYAVGELLFEMLAGERLFRGANMQILRAKVGEKPPEVSLPIELPLRARLTALISACVHQEQDQRPAVAAMQAELRDVLAKLPAEGQSVPVARPPAQDRSASLFQPTLVPSTNTAIPPPVVRKPQIILWVLAMALLAGAGAAGTIFYQRSQEPVIVYESTSLEDTKAVVAPEPEKTVEPQPEPEKTVVEPAPEPEKKKIKPKSDHGPLKKGEFPSW